MSKAWRPMGLLFCVKLEVTNCLFWFCPWLPLPERSVKTGLQLVKWLLQAAWSPGQGSSACVNLMAQGCSPCWVCSTCHTWIPGSVGKPARTSLKLLLYQRGLIGWLSIFSLSKDRGLIPRIYSPLDLSTTSFCGIMKWTVINVCHQICRNLCCCGTHLFKSQLLLTVVFSVRSLMFALT